VRHPSEKPVGLLGEMIESSSRRGELVLDPFAGVGSTGVAAVLAGRRSYQVEIDERYVQIAVDRMVSAERLAASATTI
jgi:site-specific DNA-methyltransferase (adenine-specific)